MGRAAGVEWASRGRPIPGEIESGDAALVAEFPDGLLLGLVDGLGHGPEAASAARAAIATLKAQPAEPVLRLISACHEALRGTRGAVMSLASIHSARGEMTWAGVGNVEAVLKRADPAKTPPRERILLRSGVVGYQLPPLRSTQLPLSAGDVLVLGTDGLAHAFADDTPITLGPADCADYLLRTYGRNTDDAHVLVARFGTSRG